MDKATFKQQFVREKITKKQDYNVVDYMKNKISNISGEFIYGK
jgi:hypothetical protein